MDLIVIGRVRTAHGIRGEVKVESESGESDHFLKLERVVLRKGEKTFPMSVESARRAHNAIIMRFAGIETPEQAKRWRGHEVLVERASAAQLNEGEYYYADLHGLAVWVDEDRHGTVRSVLDGGPWPLLEVETTTGVFLVPFQEHFVTSVDLASRRLFLSSTEVLE